MVQLLRNKNLATKFQILVEIAANQPFIQQKDIARRIGVTSQAVSEYISKLETDGWITSDGRSRYSVTKEGVNWVLKALREVQQYSITAERALTGITTWAAIASDSIKKGQTVNLVMRDGLLHATGFSGKGARGTATCDAREGEDIGVTDIEDIVSLVPGQVTILNIPDVQDGGSRTVDTDKVQGWLRKNGPVGAIGIEAIVTLRKTGREPDYLYGVATAAVEAARSGLQFTVVCTGSESPRLQQHLAGENISYKVIDVKSRKSRNQ
ncbi:MAG: winged helix-turn-helix transcriptional regulator [Dehalococcoidia bacterium]|nr:winged helix-turn-helix transcriptional regulator [Dehalococcoidia bacterium]